MSSKWRPWDFVRNCPKVIDTGRPGVWVVSVFDSFMERLLLKRLPKSQLNAETVTLMGPELSADWVESALQSQDLFSSGDSYLILKSQEMAKKTQESILEYLGRQEINDRHVVFMFTQENRFSAKLSKIKGVESLKMEAPRHWEAAKFLNFLCEEMRLKIPYNIQSFLLESLPMTSVDYINALNLLRLHSLSSKEGEQLTIEKVKELIQATKLDQFQLARDFSQKDFESFASTLLSLDAESEDLQRLFGFMQSHLLKLADPSYIQHKARPTKYDRQIQSDHRQWSRKDLNEYLQMFSDWEILAKRKSPRMKNSIRSFYYNHLT